MKKSTLNLIIIFGFACCLYGESNICKNVFSIPYNREMEDCYTSTPNSNLTPPFATVLKVLKTKDGLPFEEDDVVNFYKNHFESRGWKNITREGSKRSLEFQINVYDLSGNLSIWLAPNDGMLTIYMHQWRISRLSQDSQTLFEKTESDLNASAAKNEYKISQSHGPNWWIEYYENEYLVTAKLFSLSSKRVYPKGPGLGNCMSSKGRISAVLLAYRDSATAKEQAKKFESNNHVVAQRGDILVLFKNTDRSQNAVVTKIASELKN